MFQSPYGTSETQQAQEKPSTTATTTSLAAGNNEWVSNGILVEVHELIDPCSEAIEVDMASTIGFAQVGSRISFNKTGESNFRILFSNFVFEFYFQIKVSNF